MSKVPVIVSLIVLFGCCGRVLSWGGRHYRGGGGGFSYQHHHHHHPPGDYFSDRSGHYPQNEVNNHDEGYIERVLDDGPEVGRVRRQNGTAAFGGAGSNNSQSGNNFPSSCRVSNNRVLGQWRCTNGEVIDCNGLCNGRGNCRDGSDETVLSCRHVFCLDSAFRCAYGGCIRSELECNGVEDCADGSDEKTINCPGVLSRLRANGNCNEGFFQCKNGECIYDDGVCSGGAECKDGSDETAEVCSTHFCPEPGFRCDYGACILRMNRCDGKRDCVDGSDEKPELCGNVTAFPGNSQSSGNRQSIGSLSTMSLDAMPTPGPFSSSTDMRNIITLYREFIFRQEAQLAELRKENLRLQLSLLENSGRLVPTPPQSNRPVDFFDPIQSPVRRPPLPNAPISAAPINRPPSITPVEDEPKQQPTNNSPLPPISTGPREEGDCDAPVIQGGRVSDLYSRRYDNRVVKNGEEIVFECLAGTSLIGVNSTYCINGNLLHDLPLCTNMCSGLPLNTLSVQAECFEATGVKIPCSPLLPPKTIAILTCKVGYKRPDRTVPDAYNCMDDGNWNAHVYKCIPICGEVTEGRRLIVGGEESNITQVPWHSGIYEEVGSGSMQQICGGSIINPTAIVTAAHCFWDQQRRQMKDAKMFKVAVGKTLRDFDADEPTAQKFQVSEIKIYDQYMDYEGLFVSDIAVVVLEKPIIFQSYVKPVCVEYSLKGNQRYVVSGIQGRVAGWGLTSSQGAPSAVLKTLDLPTVDFNTCLNESPASFKPFITTDKFCGGFTTGESVCKGDSGGGLAFPKPSEDKSTTVYYLRGIVSVGPILQGSCDNTKYSAFTDIQLHNMFLYDYLFV